jgi:hypothetical protein
MMPYTYANYFVGLVFIITIIGFWPSYFLKIAHVPLAFHVHAFTALTWVSLVMLQVWSIQNQKNDIHRTVGKLSLFIFPFVIVGFVMIINVSAESFISAKNAFSVKITPSFGASMLFAIITYLVLFYQALKNRHNINLHAGYMLVTPLVLFESPFSRIMLDYMPFMIFTGSEGVRLILDAIVISMSMAIVFALVMYLRDRKNGLPFLVVAVLMTVQALTMAFAGDIQVWRDIFGAYSQIPEGITISAGLVIGAIVAWLGWKAPMK